jgi:hypothetical protein
MTLTAAAAGAQLPVSDYWGLESRFPSARSLAAVGTTLHEPRPAAMFGNPAFLWSQGRAAVELTGALRLNIEERTRVVYDNFENALGEVAFADNYGATGLAGPVAVAGRVGPVTLGAGAAPLRDFSYDYLKEYRDDFYIKIGEDRVRQAGSLYAAAAAAAWRPTGWLAVGLAGGYAFGRRQLEWWQIEGADTLYSIESGSPRGIAYCGGVALRPGARFSIAADYRGPIELSNWTGGEAVEAKSLPGSGGLSVSYRSSGTLPSTITAEGRYQLWGASDSVFRNTLLLRAGVEHVLLNLVRLRYGFGVEPLPANPAAQVVDLGLGLGFDAGPLVIDVGLMHQRSVLGGSDFVTPLVEDGVKVYENRTAIAVTLSRGF